MRHYFKTTSDGRVTGVATTDGGFTDDQDLSDPLNYSPQVLAHRSFAEQEEDFDQFLRWDCPCPEEAVSCSCPHMKFHHYYVENGALVEKTPITVLINGQPQPSAEFETPMDFAPGTSVTLRLQAGVPDGTKVTACPRGRVSIAQEDTELTFTGGLSDELILKAPAQGTVGYLAGVSRLVRQFRVSIRGWA